MTSSSESPWKYGVSSMHRRYTSLVFAIATSSNHSRISFSLYPNETTRRTSGGAAVRATRKPIDVQFVCLHGLRFLQTPELLAAVSQQVV